MVIVLAFSTCVVYMCGFLVLMRSWFIFMGDSAEAFEKSAGGRAARTAIAAAKANPLPSRNEPGLRV